MAAELPRQIQYRPPLIPISYPEPVQATPSGLQDAATAAQHAQQIKLLEETNQRLKQKMLDLIKALDNTRSQLENPAPQAGGPQYQQQIAALKQLIV